MTRTKLRKIRSKLEHLRLHPRGVGSGDLVSLAKKLGRERFVRGKEPTYVRPGDPTLAPPLSIPDHSGDMAIGTVRCIVEQLLSDVDEWEIYLVEQGDDESAEGQQDNNEED